MLKKERFKKDLDKMKALDYLLKRTSKGMVDLTILDLSSKEKEN